MRLTTHGPHGFSVGDRVDFHMTRPPWWRAIALWRWWRNPWRGGTSVVTSVEERAFTITRSSDQTSGPQT